MYQWPNHIGITGSIMVNDKPVEVRVQLFDEEAAWDTLYYLWEQDYMGDDSCVIRPIPVHFPGAIQSPNEA